MSQSDDRLTDLEASLTHLARQIEVLNEVVVDQAKDIGRLAKTVRDLEGLLDRLSLQLPAPEAGSALPEGVADIERTATDLMESLRGRRTLENPMVPEER